MEIAETTSKAASAGPTKHHGSCHCGKVRFSVRVDLAAGGSQCNCSVCLKLGMTTSIVKPEQFTLLSPEEELGVYEWGGKTSRRFFCRHCGTHCFGRGYLAEVGGDYVSVNLNALDDAEVTDLKLSHWDGRHDNWQAGTRDRPWPVFATNPA